MVKGEAFDIGIDRRGADTSFGDVLDIVVPYETSGSPSVVAYGAPAASCRIGLTLACSLSIRA